MKIGGLALGFLFIVSSAVADNCAYRLRMILARDSLQNEMLRLNEILIARISKQLNAMPEVQRKSLLRMLDTRGKKVNEGEGGHIVYSGLMEKARAVQMNISPDFSHHPLSRLIIAHEFDHATRATSRWTDKSSKWHSAKMAFGSEAYLNEERKAFAAEYDFLQAAYSDDNYRRLKAASVVLTEQEKQTLKTMREAKATLSKEEQAVYAPLLDRLLNRILYRHVQRARMTTKEDYVLWSLRSSNYEKMQREINASATQTYHFVAEIGSRLGIGAVALNALLRGASEDDIKAQE